MSVIRFDHHKHPATFIVPFVQKKKLRLGQVSLSQTMHMLTGKVRDFNPGLSDIRLCVGVADSVHLCVTARRFFMYRSFHVKKARIKNRRP